MLKIAGSDYSLFRNGGRKMLKIAGAVAGASVIFMTDLTKVLKIGCADWVAIPTYLVGVWVFDRERGRGSEGRRAPACPRPPADRLHRR